jgi:pre-mRNA-processing factor 39
MGKSFYKLEAYLLTSSSPTSVQPAIFKTPAGKGLENGSAPGEIDEATLRKGEVQYTTYFSQHGDLPTNAQVLVAFH